MLKKVKTGQALIETIMVLAVYFFMLGFIISGFQLMFNKTIVSIATYEYARTTIAFESAKKFDNDTTSGTMQQYQTSVDGFGVTNAGEIAASTIIKENAIAYNLLHIKEYELYGLRGAQVSGTENATKQKFDPRMHMYVQAVIRGEMDYLFPIIDPSLNGVISKSIKFESSYVLAKERVWVDKNNNKSE